MGSEESDISEGRGQDFESRRLKVVVGCTNKRGVDKLSALRKSSCSSEAREERGDEKAETHSLKVRDTCSISLVTCFYS